MDLVGILIFLLIGAIAGWLAGQIMKNGSFGKPGITPKSPSIAPAM